MKKAMLYTTGILVLCFAIMLAVNAWVTDPTVTHESEICTRYCHNSGCTHFAEKFGYTGGSGNLTQLYAMNIHWLKDNPFGLSYYEMNILVYVIVWPLLVMLGIWGLVRRKHG